jgi:(R,R)-butanediol dehydrogenase/meso-butanediol dehydrogenase/diacetyl reductase
MKAAVWYNKRDVRIEEVPEAPTPGPGQVKVKVHWCGICGSDLHEYDAGPIFIPVDNPHPLTGAQAPLILGHEFSGEVVEIGEGVTNVSLGDRVTADACQYCGGCYMCRQNRYSLCTSLAFTGLMANGAFAEYVTIPAYTLYPIPENMSMELAALIEPLAVGIHAIRRAPVIQGNSVAIVGAGPIGLVTLQAARAAGASKVFVVETAEARKRYAKELGATHVIDPCESDPVMELRRMTKGLGVDVSIECVGGEKTGALAVDLARVGGRVVLVGIFEKASQIHFNNLVFFEKEIIGSLAYYGEFEPAITLVSDGRITLEPLITAKIELKDIVEKGFEELLRNRQQHIKILVSP